MIGNGMIIKALHNAVQSRRVSPLYLFHGPGGSGKTSAAKVFASALNCESASHPKPCWVCRGCSRSQSSSFESAKTLLQSTTSDQRFPGFKVFIIDECQKLPDDSWGQLLDIIEQDKHGLLVFIVVAGNVSDIPRAVSSRCLKFSFTRLKDTDIALKLGKIVAGEDIQITDDALELIARTVEGNLREAENLVDRLALLGQTITISIVQQLVGLVPHEKLFRFLEALLRGDSIEVARSTKDLIVYCIEPRDLVLQLASLLTDILSGASSSPTTTSLTETSAEDSTMLKNTNPERLYRALRILIDTERQLRTPSSCNNVTWVTAAMLQITSDDSFNSDPTNILPPRGVDLADEKNEVASTEESVDNNRDRPSKPSNTSDMRHHTSNHLIAEHSNGHTDKLNTIITSMDIEEVWHHILQRMQNTRFQELLQRQSKLMSLTVSRANIIMHLMLTKSEKVSAPEMSEESISNALEAALGYPVTINLSCEPMRLEVMPKSFISSSGTQDSESSHMTGVSIPSSQVGRNNLEKSESQRSAIYSVNNLRPKMLQHSEHTLLQKNVCSVRENEYKLPVLSTQSRQGIKENTIVDSEMNLHRKDQFHDKTSTKKVTERKHKFLSASPIPKTDATIEAYSQDLLFETAKVHKQQESRVSKSYSERFKLNKDRHSMNYRGLSRSWSWTDKLCRGQTMVEGNIKGRVAEKHVVQRASSCNGSTKLYK